MPIAVVSTNLPVNFNGFNGKVSSNTKSMGNNIKPQNPQVNYLLDSNYGRSLIKSSKLSFTADIHNFAVPLEKKITAGLANMEHGDILLVGKNMDKAIELLGESIRAIPDAIKKLYFIKDETIDANIAFKLNSKDDLNVVNLDENHLFVMGKDQVRYFVDKAKEFFVKGGDTIFASGHPFKLSTDYKDESLVNIAQNSVYEFDISHYSKGKITNINQNSIKQLKETLFPGEHKKLSFKDVGGLDSAIKELKEQVLYPVRYPEGYGNAITHGVSLYGPPGTGKTLLANALANELGINFIKIDAPDIITKFVGEPVEAIRKAIQEAREQQPCLIFIDEINAIAKDRTTPEGKDHTSVTDQILTELNKIKENKEQVFIVTATNIQDMLDPALLRSGRIGASIYVGLPDAKGCKKILDIQNRINLSDLKISDDFDKEVFSQKLALNKMSGADIEEIAIRTRRIAFSRTGITEKMDNDTFTVDDLKTVQIEACDYEKALETLLARNNNRKTQRVESGFRSPLYQ